MKHAIMYVVYSHNVMYTHAHCLSYVQVCRILYYTNNNNSVRVKNSGDLPLHQIPAQQHKYSIFSATLQLYPPASFRHIVVSQSLTACPRSLSMCHTANSVHTNVYTHASSYQCYTQSCVQTLLFLYCLVYCITSTWKEMSGNSCTVFVCYRGIITEPMHASVFAESVKKLKPWPTLDRVQLHKEQCFTALDHLVSACW